MDQEEKDPQDGATLSSDLTEARTEQAEVQCKSVMDGLVTVLGSHGRLFRTNGKYADTARFDLTAHSVFVGNHFIVNRGKVTMPVLETAAVKADIAGLPWLTEEERTLDPVSLFRDHYLSRPNGEERYMESNFPAKPCDDMTDLEITQGIPRAEARVRLEAWMLCAAIDGTLERYVKSEPWLFSEENWWWSNPAYRDDPSRNLVIKRSWWTDGAETSWTLRARGRTRGTEVLAGGRTVATVHPDASPAEIREIQMSREVLRALESLADAAFRMQVRHRTSELDPLITDANRIIEYVHTGKSRNA